MPNEVEAYERVTFLVSEALAGTYRETFVDKRHLFRALIAGRVLESLSIAN